MDSQKDSAYLFESFNLVLKQNVFRQRKEGCVYACVCTHVHISNFGVILQVHERVECRRINADSVKATLGKNRFAAISYATWWNNNYKEKGKIKSIWHAIGYFYLEFIIFGMNITSATEVQHMQIAILNILNSN